MTIIPLLPVNSQSLTVTLGGLSVNLVLYTLATFQDLYIDVAINNSPIITGQIIKDRVLIVRQAYLGFVGDIAMIDTIGLSDPVTKELGSRFQLVYIP